MPRDPITFVPAPLDDSEMRDSVDQDVENAWQNWREDLMTSETPGTVRICQIPMNDDGAPMPTAKGQVQLGAYPVDQYDYDSLLALIRNKFMKAGETIAVRLTGYKSGNRGMVFNRTAVVKKEALASEPQTQFGEVFTALQAQQAQQAAMFREMMERREVVRAVGSIDWAGILPHIAPIAAAAVTALLTRPSRPQSDLAGMVAVFKELKDLGSGVSSENASDDSMASIIKAVGPNALQFLSTLAANRAPAVAPPPRVAQIAAPSGIQVPGSPTPAPVSSPNPIPPTTDPAAMIAAIKPHLAQLVELAVANADPVESAKLALDMLPAELDDTVFQLVDSAQSFARLSLIEPKMKDHLDWFEKFRAAAKAEYEKEDTQ